VTVFIEIDRDFQAKPGRFRSDLMTRVWWLWFAVAWSRASLPEFLARTGPWQR
jgi:hypothetical protein